MNLIQVRQTFREVSGRFDLVNDDYSDNGADLYINEGRKFLDHLVQGSQSHGIFYSHLPAGHIVVYFPLCRSIEHIYVFDLQDRYRLTKESTRFMFNCYMIKAPSERTLSKPSFYTPYFSRIVPADVNAVDFGVFSSGIELSVNPGGMNSIVVYPACETPLNIEIIGHFYSLELTGDDSENIWTTNYPMLLVMAAMRQLEIVNRNTQGVNDWNNAIMETINGINLDGAYQESIDVDQMEG